MPSADECAAVDDLIAMDSLIAKLGLNKSEFSAKLNDAKRESEDFEKTFKGIGKIFAAGGMVTAVVGFFKTVIDYAQNAKGPIDENVEAVRRFGDALDAGKQTVLGWGAQALGTLNRFGESMGRLAKFSWKSLFGEGADYAAAEALAEKTEQAAAASERSLAEAKKHAGEFTAITASLKKIDQDRAALQLKALTDQERLNQLENNYLDLRVQQANFQGTALERRRLELQTAQAQLAFETETAAQAKKTGEERKKALEAEAKQREEFEKKARLSNEAELELFELRRKAAGGLTDAERARMDVLTLQSAEKRVQVELGDLLEKGLKNLTPAEVQRLDALLKQKKTLEDQIALKLGLIDTTHQQLAMEQAITAEKLAQAEATKQAAGWSLGAMRALGGMRSYDNPAQQQQYEKESIDSARRQIDEEIKTIERQIEQLRTSGAAYGQYEIPNLQKDLQALRNRRANVEDYLYNPNYSDRLGLGIFATQKAVVGGYDPVTVQNNFQQKQTDLLTEISDRLAGRKSIFGPGTGTG